ncbi:MAG: hypothetical protein Q9209_006185 [Squamulea sp. 1 TL-2023]
MASPPTLHLRCALQSLKLQPSLFITSRTDICHIQTRHQPSTCFFHTPSRPSPQQKFLSQHPLTSIRFASDTSTHPASTHPSASSPAASNPASVPPASTISPPTRSEAQEPSSPSTTNTNPNTTPSTSTSDTLTWNTYLSLRRLRRRYSLLASLLSSTTTTTLGIFTIDRNMDYLGSLLGNTFGVDPIFMLAAATIGAGGVGWLLGPFVGEGVFRGVYRREWGRMSEKEKDFYARIRKYRVDPSLASYSNPLPDYYGEKIGSVKDFRTWMRDQRAYNRKRMAV